MVSCTVGCAGSLPPPKLDVSLEDARVSAAVHTALLNDPDLGLRGIAIESRRGVVTLAGTVRSPEEAARAVALARAVSGVRDVQSTLTADGSVGKSESKPSPP